MITQKTHNSHTFYMDKSESKRIKSDESEPHICSTDKSISKIVIFNTCSLDESESKSVNISVNIRKVKDAMNETKDEEP